MELNGIFGTEKNENKFYCKPCDFKCIYNCDWTRHLSTSKHKVSHDGMKNGTEEPKLTKKTSKFFCDCGRSYSTKSNLGKHKKSCASVHKLETEYNEIEPKMDVYDLVKYLMKENSELKTILIDQSNKLGDVTMELVKNGVNNTTNNNNNTTNTNSHNKAFNLNFFLNETCKNAMNMTEFVDSIKLQLSDLIEVGEVGYVEGISNIIVKNLKALDETERPIHCADKKREVIYIKDENKWEKEDDQKKKLRRLISKVAYKNERLLSQFKEKYPDYTDYDSKRSDQYSKIVIEAMGGEGNNNKEKEEKIIRNISKNVTISK
jgi:hypothetical protein